MVFTSESTIFSITDVGVIVIGIVILMKMFAVCIIKSIQNGVFKDDTETFLILQKQQAQIDDLRLKITEDKNEWQI